MPHASSRARTVAVALTLLALGPVVAYLVWASLPWPLIHDAPIMHYIAWRLGEGAAPYRDLFDMNFPGTYLLHMAFLPIERVLGGWVGSADLAWRDIDLGWLVLTALVIARFAAPWGRTAAVGGGLTFALYHLAGGAWQAGQRDFFLCLFLLLGALGTATALEAAPDDRRRAYARLAGAALALGAAITLKPHAALFAAALGVLVLARAPAAGLARSTVLGVALAGVAAPVVAVVAWVAARGGLGAWIALVVDYLVPVYSHIDAGPWRVYRWQVWIPMALGVLLTLGSAAWHRRFGPRHAIAALGVAYGVVHYVVQGKGWEYHLYPLAAFSAVLLFAEVEPVLAGERRRWLVAPLAACLLAAVVLLGQKGVEAAPARWLWDKESWVRWLVADLELNHAHDDVLVLDTAEGGIQALLRMQSRQPTRFLYDFPLFGDPAQPSTQRFRAEFLGELQARPPRFIVVFTHGWPSGNADRVKRFPELARLMAERYRMAAARPAYVVFVRTTYELDARRDDP